MMNEQKESTIEKDKIVKSVSLNVYADGRIELSSIVDNKLELLGLIDLLIAKKDDVTDEIIQSNNTKHIQLTTSIAVALTSLMKAVEKPTEG